jgi:hypothetical protein
VSCGILAGVVTELEDLRTPFLGGDNVCMFKKKKNMPSYVSNDIEAMRREFRHLLSHANDLSLVSRTTMISSGSLFVFGVMLMATSDDIHHDALSSVVMGWGGLLSVGLSIYLLYRVVSSGGILDEVNKINERAIELSIKIKRLEKGYKHR